MGLVPSLKINGTSEALGLCPFHDDHNPSLSVNIESGLFRCFSCDAKGDVFAFYERFKDVDFSTALKEMGKMAGEKVPSKIECVYQYTDEAGKVLFEVVRYLPKTFRQRRPDGKGGYIYNMEGVRLVPYNLPKVIASDTVYICEGEKDCDSLARLGLIATTNPQGAGKWRDDFSQYFTGKDVVILCDNDEAGKKHGQDVAKKLNGHAKSIKLIEQLPGVPHKGDVSDWIKLPDNDKEKLVELVKIASEWTPDKVDKVNVLPNDKNTKENSKHNKHNIKISTIADMLEYEQPEYLIKPILYKNTVNLLQSLPGVGKSLVVLSVADALTSNKLLWGHFDVIEKGKVLIVDEENPGSIHRDRLEKMSIDKDALIHFIHYQGVKIDDPQWLESLIKFIDEGKYVLVVFDALIRVHGAKENDSDEMSKVMWGFREIVRRGNTTVLIIHHERKSRDGEKRERSRGSGDIIGAIDSQLILEEGVMSDNGKALSLHPGKTRLKSFMPIKLVFDQDTLNITYIGTVLSGSKSLLQGIVQFLGDGIAGFEEIKQALCIPEKQLREIIKNALGKELILDSTLKQRSDYKGSPKKLFYKVNPSLSIFLRGNVSPVGGETCHIEEKRLGGNKVSGNMDSLDSVGCGVVSRHSLPHETLTEKHVSVGVKKEGVGNMKNCIENEKIFKELCTFFEQKKEVENDITGEPIDLDLMEVEL